ncbi:Putative gustatory receptor 64f [Dufourea novaeangliae]|uniref:Putative gustatory receptor 64f n=1 Tax=Dufourea novaeangliae TaxID=178035 RepID=A0A154PHT3_DUFNO|nr:Putative gustatory receptor 64f [Dufourea novaeangliae]
MLRVPFVLGAGFNAGDSQGHHEEVTQEDLARSGPPGSRRATANDSPKPELRVKEGASAPTETLRQPLRPWARRMKARFACNRRPRGGSLPERGPSSPPDSEGAIAGGANLWATHPLYEGAALELSPKGGAQFHKFNNLKSNLEATERPAMPSGSTFHPQADSLHASMRPIIMLAQCFSIFPVCGVNTPDASYLRFTWRSPKIIYSAISFVGLSMMTIFNILRIISTGVNSTKMTTFVFNGTNIIASILFLRLAMQWPALMLTWEKLEKEFSLKHRKVSKTSLSSKFKIVTIIVMIFALVEHGSSVLHGSIRAQECAYVQDNIDTVGVYFQSQFPQVFSITSYSLWKGILVDIINILSTFSWNFVDLFLILISIALVEQFRQLNSRLYSIRGKAMPEWWWAEARNDYNHLASLTRQLDSHISIMVLLSFATDLYFICIQLLFSFNPMRGIIEKLYFGFSFGFLLARTTLVSLCAASIHDESLLPAPILYSVSGSSFSTEVSFPFMFILRFPIEHCSSSCMSYVINTLTATHFTQKFKPSTGIISVLCRPTNTD